MITIIATKPTLGTVSLFIFIFLDYFVYFPNGEKYDFKRQANNDKRLDK